MKRIEPRDERDLTAAILEARLDRTPLAVIGQGSKAAIGRPAQAARSLSLAALSGVTLYEPAEMAIGARAGTPLATIEATLAARGQRLAFEPLDYRPLLGSEGEPTIGAVAAANLSGPRRIMAGACRDSLIGLRFVNGRGELIKNGGRVMKNVTGLDLVKLCAGSWGTLGVFSEVIFKVSPACERVSTLLLHGLDDLRAVEAMAMALGSPYEVTGAAHLPAGIDRMATTLLRVEGFSPSVSYRLGELRTLLRGHGAGEGLEADQSENLWRAVRDATFLVEPRSQAVWRLSIAPSRAPAAMAKLRSVLSFRHFYDWGGGLVWLATDPAGDAGEAALRAVTREMGGHATLVRAPTELRATLPVFEPLSPALMTVTTGIKTSFDPDHILNPGRMYAGV